MSRIRSIMLALWARAAPRVRIQGYDIVIRPVAGGGPVRALMGWRPDWKTKAVAEILRVRSGGFLDVGANVGQSLMDFLSAQIPSEYLGFEPNVICYQHLANLITLNRLQKCRVIPAGLSDRSQVGLLHVSGGQTDAGASIRPDLRPALEARAVPVALYRLDDLEFVNDFEVSLVKIDVEGSELEVLRGMQGFIQHKKPWIICEVLHRDRAADPTGYTARCAELMKLLCSLGYEAHQFVQSDAGGDISALLRIRTFPDKEWDERSFNECDYLFVPASDSALAVQQFSSRLHSSGVNPQPGRQ